MEGAMFVQFYHARFNSVTFCNIPAYWYAEDDCGHYYTENDDGQTRAEFAARASAYLVQFA